jgi:hypothetical protein
MGSMFGYHDCLPPFPHSLLPTAHHLKQMGARSFSAAPGISQ